MIFDKSLKMTYNSAVQTLSVIAKHWCKFKYWTEDTVLHQDAKCQKIDKEFTFAHQYINEIL